MVPGNGITCYWFILYRLHALERKEVKAVSDPAAFTIHTIGARLKKKGDLWASFLGKRLTTKN